MLSLPPVAFRYADRDYTIVLPCSASDVLCLLSLDRRTDGFEAADLRLSQGEGQRESRKQLQSVLVLNPALLTYSAFWFREENNRLADSLSEVGDWLFFNRTTFFKHLHLCNSTDSDDVNVAFGSTSNWKRPLKRFLRRRNPVKRFKFFTEFLHRIVDVEPSVMEALVGEVMIDFFQAVDFSNAENGSKRLPKGFAKRVVRNWKDGGELKQIVKSWLSDFYQSTAQLDEFERHLFNAKMSSLQQLAYGASHEINNPLANIATRAQTLIGIETDPEKRAKLAIIYEQAIRTHEMISDLMLFANPPKPQFEVVDLKRFLFELNQSVRVALGESAESNPMCDIQFIIRLAPGLSSIECDPKQLTVALRALIRNSMESIQGSNRRNESNRIELRVDVVNQSLIRFSITDTGAGVSASTSQHLFDPFFSGREAGRGLGFGLSKAWRIAHNHGGEVLFDPNQATGAKFDILLPKSVKPLSNIQRESI